MDSPGPASVLGSGGTLVDSNVEDGAVLQTGRRVERKQQTTPFRISGVLDELDWLTP